MVDYIFPSAQKQLITDAINLANLNKPRKLDASVIEESNEFCRLIVRGASDIEILQLGLILGRLEVGDILRGLHGSRQG